MVVAVLECIKDLDSVSDVLPAIAGMPEQQRSAALHLLTDYMNVLRIRAKYIDAPVVNALLERIAAEVTSAGGQGTQPPSLSA